MSEQDVWLTRLARIRIKAEMVDRMLAEQQQAYLKERANEKEKTNWKEEGF